MLNVGVVYLVMHWPGSASLTWFYNRNMQIWLHSNSPTINGVSVRPYPLFPCTLPSQPLGERWGVVAELGQLSPLSLKSPPCFFQPANGYSRRSPAQTDKYTDKYTDANSATALATSFQGAWLIPKGCSNLKQPKVYKRLTQQKRDKYKLSSAPSEAFQNLYCKKVPTNQKPVRTAILKIFWKNALI